MGIPDKRSVYVGNVDYGSTAEELIKHFGSCGEIETGLSSISTLPLIPREIRPGVKCFAQFLV